MLTQEQEQIKSELISAFKDIEALAMQKRLEYLTVEIMPESVLKDMKIERINSERGTIEQQFSSIL